MSGLSCATFPELCLHLRYLHLHKHSKRIRTKTSPPITPPRIIPRLLFLPVGVAELEFVVENAELVDVEVVELVDETLVEFVTTK